jgi:hypothetical protein
VDGSLVYTAFDTASNPTPKATESLQKIMVNVWPVDETAALWVGQLRYPGAPLHAEYQWIRHIALTLDARATQVIARVSVVDGIGRTVSGAVVKGQWSGVIVSGDTARTTDAGGIAVFYSSRSRTPAAAGAGPGQQAHGLVA